MAVKDKRIVATGYNGAPSGVPHCTKETCYRTVNHIPSGQQLDMCVANHAEANVVCQAALSGISLEGTDFYCTHMPCVTCAKLLISCKIAKLYYMHPYQSSCELIDNLWQCYARSKGLPVSEVAIRLEP